MARTETRSKLRKFATPTICNIIKLFEFVHPMPPMVDYAATATFRS